MCYKFATKYFWMYSSEIMCSKSYTYFTLIKGLNVNSSANVDGMVGSPSLHFSYRKKKQRYCFQFSMLSVVDHVIGCDTSVKYLCPCQLLLNDFIVRFHMTCKFQITDGVLMTAVNTLKHKHTMVRQCVIQAKYTLSEQNIFNIQTKKNLNVSLMKIH